jgi:hypothetical protein
MKNRTLTLFLLLNLAILPKLFSQNVSINSTGNMPDTSAMLDISSSTKGFLMPRMTSVQRDAIILPATGLTIFNLTLVAFQVNTGTPLIPAWSTLNSGFTAGNFTETGSGVLTISGGTGSVLGAGTTVQVKQANTTQNGFLSSADWNLFNSRQPQLNGTGFVKASGTTITYDNSIYLTANQGITLSGDISGSGTTAITTTLPTVNSNVGTWNNLTVNGKGLVTAGSNIGYLTANQTISFSPSGDVTGTITGTTTLAPVLAIGANKVTLGQLAQVNTGTFLGRTSASTGNVEAMTTAQAKTLLGIGGTNSGDVTLAGQNYLTIAGQVITANPVDLSGTNATGTLAPARFPALTGDVTNTVGTVATTIGAGVVTNSKLATMPTLTLKGNNTGGTTNPADLTVAQVNAILPVFTSTLNGLVPFSGGSAGKVLHADGTWKDTAAATNQWSIIGNTGTTSVTNFLGTTDLKSLKFKTNSIQGMILDSSSNVGIGTSPIFAVSNPEKLLVDAGSSSYNVISGKGNNANFLQLNIKNGNSGATASSDVVATNDAGTEANGINYVDLGVNSSGNTSTGILGGANTGYLYSTGSDFAIGNASSGKSLIFFTGGTGSNERMRVDSNGNVGIGTTSPTTALHVVKSNPGGSISILENSSTNGFSSADFLNSSGSLSGTFGYANAGTGGLFGGRDYFNSYTNDFILTANSTTPAVFVKGSNSNVGISNAAPTEKLDVTGNVRFSGALMPNNLPGNAGDFLVSSGTGVSPSWFNATTAINTVAWSIVGNSGSTSATNFVGTTDLKSLKFKTNSTQSMILDSLGNVGIGFDPVFTSGTYREKFLVDAGTTSSYNAMVVQGSVDSFFQFNIQNLSTGIHASSDVVATSNAGTETSYFVDMGINSSTNTSGIFGKSNDAYLYNSGENFFIGASTPAKSLIFMTGGTDSATNEQMHITGAGNVGIGNGAPTQKLDVTGNIKFSGALMPNNLPGNAGNILVSTGAGTAPTWASGENIVTLGSDVINSSGNSMADVTGLSFPVTAGVTYRFSALIVYSAAATTTGSRWAINGPATSLLAYSSHYPLTITSETFNSAAAYDFPSTSNASSVNTTGNIAIIDGVIKPSASGTVVVRFASEVGGSAITAKTGSSLTWW